jgi:hypothetical protein
MIVLQRGEMMLTLERNRIKNMRQDTQNTKTTVKRNR